MGNKRKRKSLPLEEIALTIGSLLGIMEIINIIRAWIKGCCPLGGESPHIHRLLYAHLTTMSKATMISLVLIFVGIYFLRKKRKETED
jgi:predicted transporter